MVGMCKKVASNNCKILYQIMNLYVLILGDPIRWAAFQKFDKNQMKTGLTLKFILVKGMKLLTK